MACQRMVWPRGEDVAGHHRLGVVAYVPSEKKDQPDATKWRKHALSLFQGELAYGRTGLCAAEFITLTAPPSALPGRPFTPTPPLTRVYRPSARFSADTVLDFVARVAGSSNLYGATVMIVSSGEPTRVCYAHKLQLKENNDVVAES